MGLPGLNRLKVTEDATRPFKIDGLDMGAGVPVLTVRHAGKSNAAYWNALLKLSNDRPASTRGGVTASKLDDARLEDIKLLSRHVVVGWTNVQENDDRNPGKTKPLEFSAENCQRFLAELAEVAPDYFAQLKNFVGDAENFRDRQPIDGVELGKP